MIIDTLLVNSTLGRVTVLYVVWLSCNTGHLITYQIKLPLRSLYWVIHVTCNVYGKCNTITKGVLYGGGWCPFEYINYRKQMAASVLDDKCLYVCECKLHLYDGTQHGFIYSRLRLCICYVFRPSLRPLSGTSLQNYYKWRYRRESKRPPVYSHWFFFIVLKNVQYRNILNII
jgi:hypothetical protein